MQDRADSEWRAVVLTALPTEYSAVREHLLDLHEKRHKRGTIYEVGAFSSELSRWQVLIAEIGAGNERAALEAERAIEVFNPHVALFVGVAGGLKDVSLGDVVAATEVFGYEAGKANRQFEPRPSVAKSTHEMVARSRAEARKSNWLERIKGLRTTAVPRVLVGPIAAGAKVVADTRSAIYKFLRRNYGHVVAVEMEGRGFLAAAEVNRQVEALVVRGISDLIDDKNQVDATGSQDQAARHAAAFAFSVLAGYARALAFNPGPREVLATAPLAMQELDTHPTINLSTLDHSASTAKISLETVRRFLNRFAESYQPYESKHRVLVDPGEVYVPLKCKPQQPKDAPATDALVWLREGLADNQAQLVLSDYGSGKSFLALELQRRLAEEYFEQPDSRPIPVVFPLKLHRSNDILNDLYRFLRENGLPVKDRDELLRLLLARCLIVIFDAIDEIPLVQTVDPSLIGEVLRRLDLRRFGQIPWIATSRTGLFATALATLQEDRAFRVAHLQEWDAAQWRRYVQLCDQDYRIFRSKDARDSFLLTVDRSPKLRVLTATPLFARMLVESWPTIRQKPNDVNRIQLYRYYTDYVLAARQQESVLPDPELRRQCLESVAAHFFKFNITSCVSDEILTIADTYVRDIGRQELANFVRIELQTYSLLACDPATTALGFSHKSFYEYFLALALLRALRQKRFTPTNALFQLYLDHGEAAFLSEFLSRQEDAILRHDLEQLLHQDTTLYTPAFRRNLVLLAVSLARVLNQEQDRNEAPYAPLAGANLANSALSGLDFANLNLEGANLRGVIADGINFYRTRMRGCNLNGAKLTGCNFSGADLRDASLEYCVITKIVGTGPPPRLAGAKLGGITTRQHDATYLTYAIKSHDEAEASWRTRALRAIQKGTIDSVMD